MWLEVGAWPGLVMLLYRLPTPLAHCTCTGSCIPSLDLAVLTQKASVLLLALLC